MSGCTKGRRGSNDTDRGEGRVRATQARRRGRVTTDAFLLRVGGKEGKGRGVAEDGGGAGEEKVRLPEIMPEIGSAGKSGLPVNGRPTKGAFLSRPNRTTKGRRGGKKAEGGGERKAAAADTAITRRGARRQGERRQAKKARRGRKGGGDGRDAAEEDHVEIDPHLHGGCQGRHGHHGAVGIATLQSG